MENYHLSKHTASWKESMINRLSNLINRNHSAAKISQVLCSNNKPLTIAIFQIRSYKLGIDSREGIMFWPKLEKKRSSKVSLGDVGLKKS